MNILYTVFTTDEYPPENLEEFNKNVRDKRFSFSEMMSEFLSIPKTMKILGVIQFFSWFSFFVCGQWPIALTSIYLIPQFCLNII